MTVDLVVAVWFGVAFAEKPKSAGSWIPVFRNKETPAEAGEIRTSPQSLAIRAAPDPAAPLVGRTTPGAAFRVFEPAEGIGCDAGWVTVEAGGYLCQEGVVPTDQVPEIQPPLLVFDPPEPAEYDDYIATGEYDHQDLERIVPQIYGRRWKQFEGDLYTNLDAFVRGDPPSSRMTGTTGERLGFLRIEETPRGPVLVRDDGRVARLDDVYLYPVSRLQGRDLEQEPLGAGMLPAITVAYEGTAVRLAPEDDAEVIETLPHHSWVTVRDEPGTWWEVPDAGGDGVPGYVADRSIRQPLPSPGRPEGVGNDELWIDVVLGPQILMMFRGDDLVYFTIVSTGIRERKTPTGVYRILEKHATKDMRSRPGASDWYEVEDVPWTMVFKPRYALHGAYWHWGFGRPASHGCVNLAPRDAKALFDRTAPMVPPGWQSIYADPDEGTVVRIRETEED